MGQITHTETTDEVIRETRRIKAVLAKSMDFDLDRILATAKQRQEKSTRIILSPPVRQAI